MNLELLNSNKGFSLMEVLASLLIFSIVIAGMGPAFVAQTKNNTQSEIRAEAVAAAEQAIDDLRFSDPRTLPTSGNTQSTYSVGDRAYNVTVSYCQNQNFCNTANNRHITVGIAYRNKTIFSTQTVFTQLR